MAYSAMPDQHLHPIRHLQSDFLLQEYLLFRSGSLLRQLLLQEQIRIDPHQLVPLFLRTHNNARSLIRHIDRDELLQAMVKSYLGN